MKQDLRLWASYGLKRTQAIQHIRPKSISDKRNSDTGNSGTRSSFPRTFFSLSSPISRESIGPYATRMRKNLTYRPHTADVRHARWENKDRRKAGVGGSVLRSNQPVPCSSPPSPVPHQCDIPMIPVYISVKRPKYGTLPKGVRHTYGRNAHSERQRIARESDRDRAEDSLGATSVISLRGVRDVACPLTTRDWFEYSGVLVRQLFACAPVFFRSVVEGLSKDCRTSLEQQSNNCRRDIEESCVCTHAKAPTRGGLGLALGMVAIMLLTTICLKVHAQRSASPWYMLQGAVVDTIGKPIVGATVSIKESSEKTQTDRNGRFSIKTSVPTGMVEVAFLGYETTQLAFTLPRSDTIRFTLVPLVQLLEEVAINTGYESVSAERMTGAYAQIDNELLNRRVSTNILDRIDGIASGLIFPKYTSQEMGSQPTIAIRGRSTIFANAEPLVILDNFSYDGDISNINPNDVESVTVLKDGAAASIWGAQSGNGVIVITTKQGQKGDKPKITVTANTSIAEKPDVYYAPQLSSAEYIEVEKFLFEQGAFNSRLRTAYQPVSPVVELLQAIANGSMGEADGMAQINALTSIDTRDQLKQYVYQHSVNQQYNANITGGNDMQRYFVSFGYDGNQGDRVGDNAERYTVNAKSSYSFFNRRLTLHSQLLFTARNNTAPHVISLDYPYELLADEAGNALTAVGSVRISYADTAGNGRLLDWQFRPLEEMGLRGTSTKSVDYRVNVGLDYKVVDGLQASVKYQYGRSTGNNLIRYGKDSYYVRNLINQLSQIDEVAGEVTRAVPIGEVRINGLSNRTAHYVRGQLNFDRSWGNLHEFSALAAFEATDNRYEANNVHLYGYDAATATNAMVDFMSSLPRYYGGSQRLQNSNYQSWTHDRFRSYIMNASYTFAKRYTLYGSARRDESNLFGVATNQKGVPLWSLGMAWNAHDEKFLDVNWINQLKLRLSYGVQGNVDKTVSALLTARYESFINAYGLPVATVGNPPNPSLRWEKVKAYNAGLDFELWNGTIAGQIDIYRKVGVDLIANSPIAAQTGIVEFRGNTADILTRGVDVSLQIRPLKHVLSWNASLLYNYTADKVTDYKVEQSNNLSYMRNNYLNPFEGKPQSALFSFPYAGLDAAGNPLGYVDREISEDYTAIATSRGLENMIYHGPRTPRHFGGLRNDFSYRNIFLSFNITYRFDYYFRRQSLNNNSVYSPTFGHRGVVDYTSRWKAPGDEHTTNVPALVYPANSNRTNFYIYSDALVEKADHIRLQDIQFGVKFDRPAGFGRLFSGLKISAYLNNLAILWRANNHGLDPDVFQSSYPAQRTYAINISASF